MAQQNIDFGSFPNDPAADPIRAAFQKVQQNFTDLYATQFSTGVVEVTAGAGLDQNRSNGFVTLTSNISSITIKTSGFTNSTNSLRVGVLTTPTSNTATIEQYNQPFTIDLAPNITTVNANFTGSLFSANFSLTGSVNSSLIPGGNQVYDLGTPTRRWKDLFLSGNSLSLGAITMNEIGGALFVPNVTVSGNIDAGTISAGTVAGNLTSAVQPNITSVGTLQALQVAGTIQAANMAVTGSFTAGTIYGNVVLPPGATIQAPGADTELIFNDSGVQSAVSGMKFNKANSLLSIQGNITGANINSGNATFTGNIGVNKVVATGNIEGSNIVTLGVVSTTTGITTGANLEITNISGSGSLVTVTFATQSSIPFSSGSNITISGVSPDSYNGTWTVATGTTSSITFTSSLTASASFSSARIRGNGNTTINGVLEVVGNTSIGNISSVNLITGNAIQLSGNITANVFTAQMFTGNGANITFVNASNVVGIVANSTYSASAAVAATSATTDLANNIRQGSYSNITGVGTLLSLNVSGDFGTSTGNSSIGGYLRMSVNNSITAAGSSQATATVLTKTINVITSVASGTGVVLPAAVAGQIIYVINDTNSGIVVYPSSGQFIDTQAQNAGFAIGAYGRMQFVAASVSKYYSMTAIYA